MNARSYYSILFGLCLAVLSSSALGSALADPLGRIGGMGNAPVSNVRLPVPFHFHNLASAAWSVESSYDSLKARLNFRFTGKGISMNLPAVVGYSRAAAVSAVRGCIATGPYCFAGAAIGAGVGLGIQSFLSESGYDVTSSGSIVSNSTVDTIAPASGSCLSRSSTSTGSACLVDGFLPDFNGAQPGSIGGETQYSSVHAYLLARNPLYSHIHQGFCSVSGGNVSCTQTAPVLKTGFILHQVGTTQVRYNLEYYTIAYTQFYSNNGQPTQSRINTYFSTSPVSITVAGSQPSPALPFSSVVNDLPAGAEADPSVLLNTLDFDLYEPDSSDLAIIGDRLAHVPPVSIDFVTPDTYTLAPTTEIAYDELGVPITTTYTTTVTPAVVNNGTAAPSIQVATNTNTLVESPDGVISDTTTGTIVRPDVNEGVNPDTGEPYPPSSNADTAYDCWSFQFICDWFAWTQDLPDVSIDELEPDFDELKTQREIDYIQRSVNVGVPASCPTGNSLDLGYFGEYTVSYDSFCDLAVSAKPLFLTFMSLLSLFIVYRAFSS